MSDERSATKRVQRFQAYENLLASCDTDDDPPPVSLENLDQNVVQGYSK